MWLNHVGLITDILPEQKSAVTFIDPQKASHLGVADRQLELGCLLCCAGLGWAGQDKSSGTAAQTDLLLGESSSDLHLGLWPANPVVRESHLTVHAG